jgi:hypothetical protein
VALGISLGVAAFALAPKNQYSVDPNSPDDMARVAQDMVSVRGSLLRWSGGLFALALLCAPLAPLFPRSTLGPRVDVSYSILKESLVADIGGRGLAPGTPVAAALRFADADDTSLAVQGRQVASDSGKLSLKLAAKVPDKPRGVDILVTCPGVSGGCVESTVHVALRRAAPPAREAPAGRGSPPVRR